ncbi:MAG: transcriptional repressor LexA [Candidatus Tectomicrobia bacterium]|nr:transcriptional repressor LexA [Candidatus Tectomicrobia bacterium]
MKPKLTEKQKEIFSYIVKMVQTTGYPPTIRQIGEQFHISSTNGVRAHLFALQKKEYIKRRARTSRGIELTDETLRRLPSSSVVEIPVLGRVAAGTPILAVENIEGTVVLDKLFARSEATFALRIVGDSMIEDGILSGDYVLVHPQQTATNGDIVVALVGEEAEEATVKRFYKEKEAIRLQPANSSLKPIFARDVQIVGKVVGLIRTAM